VILNRRVAVVLPAYNAAKTLERTYAEIPHDIVDDVILTDDASTDATAAIARSLGLHVIKHGRNRGYGGNQKTCYAAALQRGADIVVMLHPDYQYSPKLVTAMTSMITSEQYTPSSLPASSAAGSWPEECRSTNTQRTGC
jgi:glycosyltransferase involved in cell wall biosynthesis